jgi:uncharacterized protein (TIGR03435 family)
MKRGVRATSCAALVIAGAGQIAAAQGQPASPETPRFDVASVRPHRSADDVTFALDFHEGGRFSAIGTLRMLVRTAYRLQDSQLVSAAAWIDAERFAIEARAAQDATPDQMRVMLRLLLMERFGLALRRESREAPVYALRMANTGREFGPRLRPAVDVCPSGACNIRFGPGALLARGVGIATLASELSMWVDRIVTDHTGLTGAFDLDLEWTPDQLPAAPAAISTPDPPARSANAPSIFTAVREQLGLRLEPERGQVDVLVVDRAERPAAN